MRQSGQSIFLVLSVSVAIALCVNAFLFMTAPYSHALEGESISAADIKPRTLYVAINGNDENPGTEALPLRTIQKAADTAVAGDTVVVKGGTYDERVTFKTGTTGTAGKKITFQAFPHRSVYMNGFNTTNCEYLRIEGFSITYNMGSWLGGGIWISSSNVEIVDNYFYDIPGSAIQPTWQTGKTTDNIYLANNHIYRCNKGFVVMGSNWLVENNEVERLVYYNEDADYSRIFGRNHIIRNNYYHGTLQEEVGDSHTDAFQSFPSYGYGAINILIENNIVTGFHHQGFMLSGDAETHDSIIIRNNIIQGAISWGICAVGISNIKVYNNLFANIGIHGVGFRLNGSYPSSGEIINNIFYNSGSNYWAESGCVLNGRSNLIYRTNESIDPFKYPNDIVNRNPTFVDDVGGDFRLQGVSPAIDTGFALDGFDTDILGMSRPIGSGWDIGPYEYISRKNLASPRNLHIVIVGH